jgi:hypothetical protein
MIPFWGKDYSWIEFIGSANAAFVGAGAAILAAWWQMRRQASMAAQATRERTSIEAADELAQAAENLRRALRRAWQALDWYAARDAVDSYDA